MTEVARLVLDSFAVLAYLDDEAGADGIQRLLTSASENEARLWMAVVNLCEVLYIVEREQSVEAAQKVLGLIDELPIEMADADLTLSLAAAHVKARFPFSYAGAFAIALAQQLDAPVVTGDPEFRQVEELVPVWWLPGDSP